jgi:hypothetical protein
MHPPISREQFDLLLPLASEWAAGEEQRILITGEPLVDTQLLDARLIGVAHPDLVRILYVPEIPVPPHPMLREAVEITHLISPLTGGLTLRYGILIRSDCRGNRALIVHELGHVLQYERLGSINAFLSQYLLECLTIGYPEAPMEQEVVSLTARLCFPENFSD